MSLPDLNTLDPNWLTTKKFPYFGEMTVSAKCAGNTGIVEFTLGYGSGIYISYEGKRQGVPRQVLFQFKENTIKEYMDFAVRGYLIKWDGELGVRLKPSYEYATMLDHAARNPITGYVYILKLSPSEDVEQQYKIGYTTNVVARVKRHVSGQYKGASLVGYLRGNYEYENYCHKIMWQYNVGGHPEVFYENHHIKTLLKSDMWVSK